MSWPNLFLIAAPRAGSTQLARWLDSHPDIALAPIKEPNHFSAHEFPCDYVARHHLDDVNPARYVRSLRRRPAQFAIFRDAGHYRALFAPLTARWRCDASTTYLACPEAPAAILSACGPGARAITLTRDPVARAISHYRLALRTGRWRASLRAAIERELSPLCPLPERFVLRPSRQAEGVTRVAAVFGPERHLALTFEEMTRDPAATLARVAAFLDVDPAGFDLSREGRNASRAPRWPALNAWAQATGLKTALRRALPPRAKRALGRIYFRDFPPPLPSREEIALLEAALAGEMEGCAA
jgi:hypothetical protein